MAGTGGGRIVFEPTGPFHRRFETTFSGHLPLVKVNPLQARRFAQAHGARAKTDAVDARMLAVIGRALERVPDRPIDRKERELKELHVARVGLPRDRTVLINRLATQTLGLTRWLTRARLAQAERQIAKLDAEIGTLPTKQIAALAGLPPTTRVSSQWHGKARIQGGRRHLRHVLFTPAPVTMKRNPDLAAKYVALRAAGKSHKVALTVLMRKLLILANTRLKENRPWQPKSD